jgi:hypothetical protein
MMWPALRVATSSSIQSSKSVSMNPNCRLGFLLEDTFNSDRYQKVLAVALSAPLSTCVRP